MPKSHLSLQPAKSNDTLQPDKSITSIASCVTAFARSSRTLKTPIRRLFFKLEVLKPIASGKGKKGACVNQGSDSGQTLDLTTDTPPLSPDTASSPITDISTPEHNQPVKRSRSLLEQHTPRVARVALQDSDRIIDAVAISTLVNLPFCRYGDMLSMTPAQVIEVAKEMNEHLPEDLRIDLNEPCDPTEVRKEVERLVEIVKKASEVPVPGAPLKKTKSRGRWDSDKVLDGDAMEELDLRGTSPPTSPLAVISATRFRRQLAGANIGTIFSPTRLAMLREEDEEKEGDVEMVEAANAQVDGARKDPDGDIFRVIKKRKTFELSENATPTTMGRRIKVPVMLKKLHNEINNTSPTLHRTLTTRSRRNVVFDPTIVGRSAKPEKVLVKTTVVDRSLVHARARYRSSSRPAHHHGPLQTSTLRKDTFTSPTDVHFRKVRPSPVPKPKDVAFECSVGISKIPRYRRSKQGARPAIGRASGSATFGSEARKDTDTNKSP